MAASYATEGTIRRGFTFKCIKRHPLDAPKELRRRIDLTLLVHPCSCSQIKTKRVWIRQKSTLGEEKAETRSLDVPLRLLLYNSITLKKRRLRNRFFFHIDDGWLRLSSSGFTHFFIMSQRKSVTTIFFCRFIMRLARILYYQNARVKKSISNPITVRA